MTGAIVSLGLERGIMFLGEAPPAHGADLRSLSHASMNFMIPSIRIKISLMKFARSSLEQPGFVQEDKALWILF